MFLTFLNDNPPCAKLCFHTVYRCPVSRGRVTKPPLGSNVERISESAQLLKPRLHVGYFYSHWQHDTSFQCCRDCEVVLLHV